ncbi:MAG TPA: hypothetical protein VGK20_08990 [Candidatus Binatia bacterium]|jgi:hypothetical protein
MLIDAFAPDPDAVETHRIEIHAPPPVVYDALWATDIGASSIIRALTELRSLPARIAGKRDSRAGSPAFNLQALIDRGFGRIAEDPGREIVLGVSGRFWRPVDNLLPFREQDFRGAVAPGTARAVWNFAVTPKGPSRTLLTTETRVVCGDAASRIKFRAYWMLIRPFSGLIRRIMLREIARNCLRAAPGARNTGIE